MKRTLLLIAALLSAAPLSAQTRTPADVVNDMGALVTELRALLAPPVPATPVLTTAAQLTAALQAGGEYRLAPGTYAGNFIISKPTRLHGVAGTGRVAPADVAAVMLVPAVPTVSSVTITASDVLLEGLTVLLGNNDRTAIVVGDAAATDASTQPARVTLDRVAVLAGASGGLRGIALHGSALTVTRSYVAGFWFQGRDAQAVWILNGPGPYTIEDNYLEGSGENMLVGGGSIKIPNVVPSDLIVRHNTFFKPQAWRTKTGSVKNLLEFKCAQRVLVEDNILDGNWKDAQDGSSIMLTVRNQYGDNPWCIVNDVTLRGNVLRNAPEGYAVNILGHDNNFPSQQSLRHTIEHNLFLDATSGIKVGRGVAERLAIARNTFPAVTGQIFNFNGQNADASVLVRTPLVFDGNVGKGGAYGLKLDGVASGVPSLTAATTVLSFAKNVIEGTSARSIPWPAGTTVLPVGGLTPRLDADSHYLTDPTMGW